MREHELKHFEDILKERKVQIKKNIEDSMREIEDLKDMFLLNDKERIMTMGKNSLKMIRKNNSFTQYETKIKNILKEEFI